jgi:hypothetical protein
VGEHTRDWMHARLVERLGSSGYRWLLVSGSPAARLHLAIDAVEELLGAYAPHPPPMVATPHPPCHGHRVHVDELVPSPSRL